MSSTQLREVEPGSIFEYIQKPILTSLNGWAPVSPPDNVVTYLAVPDFESRLSVMSSVQGRKDRWNPCQHYSKVANKESILMLYHKSGPNSFGFPVKTWHFEGLYPSVLAWNQVDFGFPDTPLKVLQEMSSTVNGELFVPPPENLVELLDAAHVAILPNIRPQVSLINSIIELKDFKSLGKTITHMADTIKRLDKIATSFGKNVADALAHLSPREIMRRGGDSYLQYKFNLAPLRSDIEGLFKTFNSFKHKSRRLVQQSERNRIRHWSSDVSADYADVTLDSAKSFELLGSGPEYSMSHLRQTLLPAKFHVELLYNYYYTEFQKQHAALLTSLDMVGLNLNPAIIWNAIPYSFMVDWVAGIGRALNRFSRANMEPVIVIQKSLWSIRRERNIECSVDAGGQIGIPVSSVKEVAYRREPYQMGLHSVNLSGLDLNEVSLLSALVSTRHRTY